MTTMMSKVVEEGTAKRATLDGIKAAGKTGTTNAYRDAWFIGFTGNYIAGVWYGNDDYTATNRMTGGSLPAQTWHDIMEYAHQGIELKSIPGLLGPQPPAARAMAEAKPSTADGPPRPPILTKRGTDILGRVERLMDDATRALVARDQPPAGPMRLGDAANSPGQRASASDQQQPTGGVRGN
jgi:penicillin-binding protein 1A